MISKILKYFFKQFEKEYLTEDELKQQELMREIYVMARGLYENTKK